MAIIYTNQRSKKKSKPKTKSFLRAQEEHRKFLASMGISAQKSRERVSRVLEVDDTPTRKVAPTSDTIPSNGFKSTIDDYKWKRDSVEKKEVIQETERKKSRIAPYTNKGAYMYISDEEDAKSLGRKL